MSLIMEINDTIKQLEYIYMVSKSQESSADQYGDFVYYENYLRKYVYKSKLWDYKIMKGSSRGNGIAGVLVKTTLDALKILGGNQIMKDTSALSMIA